MRKIISSRRREQLQREIAEVNSKQHDDAFLENLREIARQLDDLQDVLDTTTRGMVPQGDTP